MSGELGRLVPPKGANRKPRIRSRGIAAGQGKTGGRGGKGQSARKSGQVRLGFEGGQMPMQRRLPKRGFRNPFAKHFAEVRLMDLNRFAAGASVDLMSLRAVGLAKGRCDGVKILGNGEITRAVFVRVSRVSRSAREKIEAAGGRVELIADRVKWRREGTRAQRRAEKKNAS